MEATKTPMEKPPQAVSPTGSSSARMKMPLVPLERTVTIVAIVVIGFFLLAVVVMYVNVEHAQWERMAVLLGSVQTVTLVAAGFLFGKQALSKIAQAIRK